METIYISEFNESLAPTTFEKYINYIKNKSKCHSNPVFHVVTLKSKNSTVLKCSCFMHKNNSTQN